MGGHRQRSGALTPPNLEPCPPHAITHAWTRTRRRTRPRYLRTTRGAPCRHTHTWCPPAHPCCTTSGAHTVSSACARPHSRTHTYAHSPAVGTEQKAQEDGQDHKRRAAPPNICGLRATLEETRLCLPNRQVEDIARRPLILFPRREPTPTREPDRDAPSATTTAPRRPRRLPAKLALEEEDVLRLSASLFEGLAGRSPTTWRRKMPCWWARALDECRSSDEYVVVERDTVEETDGSRQGRATLC